MKENSVEDFDSLFVKKRTGAKLFVIVFSLVVLAFITVYAYLSISSVRDHMEVAISKAAGTVAVDPSLIDLMKEKAWIESRLEMASSDSIGLSIDLEKHIVQLELKGVAVMKSKIRDYKISGLFKKMEGNVYFSMFGSPLTVLKYESTIEKNPLKVVQAPKDTIAAAAAAIAAAKKDSLLDENVFWTVKLDRDFELNIQGIDSVAESQSKYKFGKGFEFQRDMDNILNSLQHVLKFQKPTYKPEILISIPENEAKAILRAMPRAGNAKVTIRI